MAKSSASRDAAKSAAKAAQAKRAAKQRPGSDSRASQPPKQPPNGGPQATPKRAPPRPSFDARISAESRVALYAASRVLTSDIREECRLKIPLTAYMQDPADARENPELGLNSDVLVDWEPGLLDGPTSARFAIVDFNGDTGQLTPPAEWIEKENAYFHAGQKLDQGSAELPQFRQVNVWAILQRALEFFENGVALGRRIPWAFEGNRLIVVPQAGWGENAFYDRASKSLQFYYCGPPDKPVYTCLSSDIVNHEFGHAVLDGIRPFFNESTLPQTAAFHEFLGDLTAILLTLRDTKLRRLLADETGGNIAKATTISGIAKEFGKAVKNRPYLRTAQHDLRMSDMKGVTEPHQLSEVLTGAMFEILVALAKHDQKVSPEPPDSRAAQDAPAAGRKRTPRQAFRDAADRMQRMAIQPLDLLPPVDVTFKDYAIAVCRAQQLAEPLDPKGYYDLLIDVFVAREILTQEDAVKLREPEYLYDRFPLSVYHDIGEISRSRAAAYRFLDDNREDLLIPAHQDLFVADLYDANKRTRQGIRLPRQIVLEYVWREDVELQGERFGRYQGQSTTMLCGGTLVFNDSGNVLSWARKPGSVPYGGKRPRGGHVARKWEEGVAEGERRLTAMLDSLATQIAAGRVGAVASAANGFIGGRVPPLIAEGDDDQVRFRIAPHLSISHDHDHDEEGGGRPWEMIS